MTKYSIYFILLGSFLLNPSFTKAQEDFSSMSAKQRIKVAKKEQKAAKKDKEYLAMMDEALTAFQALDYVKAKELYEKAHERRPDNVYPMVMLDDIALAIEAEKNQVNTEEVIVEQEIITEAAPEVDIKKEEVKPQEIDNAVQEEIILPKDPEKVIEQEKQGTETKAENKVIIKEEVEPKEILEDQIIRKEYKEGSASVEEIIIIEKGVSTSYRKVSHTWGAVYYFKNKDDISKEEWKKLIESIE